MEKERATDIGKWVSEASNPADREFREAIHVVLLAISSEQTLRKNMVLKGGMLLAVRYHSHRYTKDVDLSTSQKLFEFEQEKVKKLLEQSLALASEQLDYSIDCRVQRFKVEPPNKPKATFPSVDLSIGYAYKGTAKYKKLQSRQSPTCVRIDYSLNEVMPNVESLKVGDDSDLLVYPLTDLIAEKFRALLQQKSRDRFRRQDIFDLSFLLNMNGNFDGGDREKILSVLREKSISRNLTVDSESMDDEEIKYRAKAEYGTLADEVWGRLPDFDKSYEQVVEFYKSLPWNQSLQNN